jgi:pilus assembly protein CpaE
LPGECLLLDLGLPYNNAALAANLVPTGCVAIADIRDDGVLYATLMRSMARHHSGMFLLPATQRLEHSELITPDLVQRVTGVLLGTFSEMIIDLGVALSETALRVLESADRVVLVVTPELASLKNTAELLELFKSVLGIGDDRVHLTLNRPRPETVIATGDVERALGRSPETILAFEGPRLDRATVAGDLMLFSRPHSPFSKAIRAIADQPPGHRKRRAS